MKKVKNSTAVPQANVPAGFVYRVRGNTALIVRKEYEASRGLTAILTEFPNAVHPGAEDLPGGRGSAYSVSLAGAGKVVVRHYRRGGLIGWLLFDRYLSGSRPFRELGVLARAHSRGVPVPEVLGASSARVDLIWHRCRIVTRLIPDSLTLPEFINWQRDDAPRVALVLKKAGGAIRMMHDAGIDHSDLNMNNILVDKNGSVCLIDFDKAAAGQPLGMRARIANLRRLLRSLRKLRAARHPLEDADFSMIIDGYAKGDRHFADALRKTTVESVSLALRSVLSRLLGGI